MGLPNPPIDLARHVLGEKKSEYPALLQIHTSSVFQSRPPPFLEPQPLGLIRPSSPLPHGFYKVFRDFPLIFSIGPLPSRTSSPSGS